MFHESVFYLVYHFIVPRSTYIFLVCLSSHFQFYDFLFSLQSNKNSEALTTQTFHWVLARVQHHLDMLTSDKKNLMLWGKRLHIAIQVKKKLFFLFCKLLLLFFCF